MQSGKREAKEEARGQLPTAFHESHCTGVAGNGNQTKMALFVIMSTLAALPTHCATPSENFYNVLEERIMKKQGNTNKCRIAFEPNGVFGAESSSFF